MRSQPERDSVTLAIVGAMALFVLVAGAVLLLGLLARSLGVPMATDMLAALPLLAGTLAVVLRLSRAR